MFYSKCPYCGSNNDPGEKCECQKEKSTAARNIHKTAYNGAYRGEYMKTYSAMLGKGLPACIANDIAEKSAQGKAATVANATVNSFHASIGRKQQ